MNILLITHYYPPEIGAPQARLSEMAATWVSDGNMVTALTCFPNHPTGTIPAEYLAIYKKKRYYEELMDGITVVRCWVYATPNKGFAKKILGHLSFMISAAVQGRKHARGKDIIIVSSPTFFSVFSAWFFSKMYRIPYIFEVRDLWPAIFVELGVLRNKTIIRILECMELFLYRQAQAVVTVTKSFAGNIADRGISSEKIHVIYNGADLTAFKPKEKNSALLTKHKLTDKFIVMYLGAHGISHALHRILEVAKMLKTHPAIQFMFVGEGAEKEKLVALSQQLELNNLTFIEGQKKEMVPEFYSIMDVGLVPLRNIALFDTFIPSKMFEIMAMKKPIVASVKGEAAEILHASGAAIVCPPENVRAIADALLKLFYDENKRLLLSESGRKFVIREFDRAVLARKYLSIMKTVAHNPEKGRPLI